MLLAEIAATTDAVRAEPRRTAKIALLAACIVRLAACEITPGVAFLSGQLRQRQTGVGHAALRDLPPAAANPTLTIIEADNRLDAISREAGAGSRITRRGQLDALFAAATPAEQRLLRGLLTGELRQGAETSLVADAVIRAAAVPEAAFRRAFMLSGDLGRVAAVAFDAGQRGLEAVSLTVGQPILPMLAQTAASVDDAVLPAAAEFKLDGARIQVHRDGRDVRIYTRSLDDVTTRLGEVVDAVLALAVDNVVLDGEALVLRGIRSDAGVMACRSSARSAAGRSISGS